MAQMTISTKTFEDFIKVKGELMVKTGKAQQNDGVLAFLINEYQKRGGDSGSKKRI